MATVLQKFEKRMVKLGYEIATITAVGNSVRATVVTSRGKGSGKPWSEVPVAVAYVEYTITKGRGVLKVAEFKTRADLIGYLDTLSHSDLSPNDKYFLDRSFIVMGYEPLSRG